MAVDNNPETVWNVVKKVGTAMLITHDGEQLEGRPLQAYPDPDMGLIHFMTDSDRVLEQIQDDPRVMLSFADRGGNNFASISGSAEVTNDRAKIKELWSPWAKAFWESPEDPAIRVIVFHPDHARYWDAPNAVVTTIITMAAAVVGKEPELGKSGEVNL
jgi:general stress protein 26